MTEINFKSTYRIPITQAGMNSAKKKALKSMVLGYENSLVGNGNTGFARVSIPKSEDNIFVQKLKQIGCKIYQVFDEHNLNLSEIDEYIKDALNQRDFQQRGKQMKKGASVKKHISSEKMFAECTPETRAQERAELAQIVPKKVVSPRTDEGKKEQLRKTPDYIRIKDKYGEEFAEVLFFGRK